VQRKLSPIFQDSPSDYGILAEELLEESGTRQLTRLDRCFDNHRG
jgi:hypothetical protein